MWRDSQGNGQIVAKEGCIIVGAATKDLDTRPLNQGLHMPIALLAIMAYGGLSMNVLPAIALRQLQQHRNM